MAWLGALPLSANALGQMQTVSEPFVWGRDGSRMTPEDVAFQRRLAASEQQIDYSPVGHWLQGAARLSDNIGGALRERQADRAADANAAEGDAVMQALMAGGNGASTSGVTAALLNPFIPEEVKNFARMQWERANPKPQQPTDFQQTLRGAGIKEGSPEWLAQNLARANSLTDPEIVVPLPDGRTYVGPRSGLSELLKGGGPVSPGPEATPPPSTLPPDFDFNEGGPTQPASARFP